MKLSHDDPHTQVDWSEWGFNYNINGVDPPAATWVEVRRLLHPAFLVEIELIAELA